MREANPILLAFQRQLFFSGVQSALPVLLSGIPCSIVFFRISGTFMPWQDGGEVAALLADLSSDLLAILIPGLIFCARSISAITSELGLMQINGEIRALNRLGIPISSYIILPRVAGASVALVLLYIYFIAAVVASCIVLDGSNSIVLSVISALKGVNAFDFTLGIIRSALFASILVWRSSRTLKKQKRGIPDVSRTASNTVLEAMMMLLVMEGIWQIAFR